MPKKNQIPGPVEKQERRNYGAAFFVLAAMLAFLSFWSVADEMFHRRPWKHYQSEFFELEIAKAEVALDGAEKELRAEQTAARIEEIEQAIAGTIEERRKPEYRRTKTEVEALSLEVEKMERRYQFAKSVSDERFYYYKHAQHEGHDFSSEKSALDEIEQEMALLQQEIARLDAERTEVGAPVATNLAIADSLEGLLHKIHMPFEDAQRALEGAKTPLRQAVTQAVLPAFETNEFGQKVARVERCENCHLGVNRTGFEDAPQPHATHPKREILLGAHPPEQFGCTPCHQGDGVALDTVHDAHGHDHHFGKPILESPMIESTCARCHNDQFEFEATPTLTRGRKTVEKHGCTGCHRIAGMSDRRVGPPLYHVGDKVFPEWLPRWLDAPESYLTNVRMPDFQLGLKRSTAISAYLLSLSSEWDEIGSISMEGADAEAGRWVFEERGCQACHAIDGEGGDHGPDLSKAGEKLVPEWVAAWVKQPRHYSPDARMPSLRLTDDEARDVAAFVTSRGARRADAALERKLNDPEMIDMGEELVGEFGCFGCHLIEGMETRSRIGIELSSFGSKDEHLLDFGDRTDVPHLWENWVTEKLKDPRTFRTERIDSRMPVFPFSDDEETIESVVVFLASRTGLPAPEGYGRELSSVETKIEEGRTLLRRYNCQGCHLVEGTGGLINEFITEPGMAPPILTYEGAKVQPDWLFNFLKSPYAIRPWLDARMPSYEMPDDEAQALVDYFIAIEGRDQSYVYTNPGEIPEEQVASGEQWLTAFKCLQCHVAPELAPNKKPSEMAPNLVLAKERLQPSWISDWLWDPQGMMPGTKMPSYFYSDGDTLMEEAFTMIDPIRDFLQWIEDDDVERIRGG
ncbi:MAG: hypothetical protein CME06_02255 [Gemmatimonadetes bacterium]|nr:hypothetical protein [Gemmatimonadota bacterium]